MMSTSVSKAMNAFSAELIRACALKYGFDGEEAMRELSVCLVEGKKTKAKKEAAPKAAAREMPSIPLPFTGVVRDDCCLGVKQNHGLYTQCFSAPGESGLCKGCSKQASKNASGEPDCGLIAKRVMQGSEYRDAKGRAPVHYTKVMKKQKLTEEQVQSEAAKFGIEIDASHFAIPETKRGRPKKATTSDTDSDASSATGEKKARGRPKKAAKVVEVNATEDLFASLMEQAQSASPRPAAAAGGGSAEEMSDVSSNSGSSEAEESDSESKGSKKKTKKSKEESEEELAKKAAKFLAKEEEKEKKAAARAQEKEAEKAKKLAEKEAEKAKKLAEKEAEKAKKLAEKEAEKEAEKAKKLAEKEAAKTAKEEKPKKEKAKKEKASKKKAQAQQEKEPVKPVEPVADLEPESEEEEAEPTVTVKKFEHQGVIYLKSSDGVLYDAKTQEVVGKWNETTKSIDVYDGESDEDSDEDSDEESDDE